MDRTEWVIARTKHAIVETLMTCPDGRLPDIAEIVARQLHDAGLLRREDKPAPRVGWAE